MTRQHGLIATAAGGILLAVSAFLDRLTYDWKLPGVEDLPASDRVLDPLVGKIILIGGVAMFALAIIATVMDDAYEVLLKIARLAPIAAVWMVIGAFSDRSDFAKEATEYGLDSTASLGVGLFIAIAGTVIAFAGMFIANSKTEQPVTTSTDPAAQMASYDAARAAESAEE